MNVRWTLAMLALAVPVVMVACSAENEAENQSSETDPGTSLLTTTTRPSPTAREIYDLVAPSVAFLETDVSTGSAVLTDDGWVVTNAHVVWPRDSVRLVFADGEEHEDVPVQRIDDYLDLALLGPIESERRGIPLLESIDVATADEVYLIGYPAESEDFPTPSITRGLVARLRRWEATGFDFIQSDTAIAGGQSGGALVAADGTVIGISGLTFSDAGFALSLPIDAVTEAVADLVIGASPQPFADSINIAPQVREAEIRLSHTWDEEAFVFEGADEPTSLTLAGGSEPFLTVLDTFGEMIYPAADEEPEITADGRVFTFDTGGFGPVYAYVTDVSVDATIVVTSDQAFSHVIDKDDARLLRIGSTTKGSFGIPGDYDWFAIELNAGEAITVDVDSLGDVELLIDTADAESIPLAEDFDSGGGLFDTNPEVEFTADQAGVYVIVIYEAFAEAPAGYVLTVE
ncbi:MAG: hypothetical protein HKO10_02610 [Acidimicrobiia bacterium]|nr:hypothetical protein [Acidimicrobiia bacterium]